MRTAEELAPEDELETATFAMGCFWGPEALFGAKDGVVSTRVGYTGGEKDNPTYRSLGDHTETVQIDYDPRKISYEDLLEIFWNNHNPSRKQKKQYASRIFYHDRNQKKLAEESKQRYENKHVNTHTEILPAETFWIAEDYHQKYRLRQRRDLMSDFSDLSPEEFINSPEAAEMNGKAAGYEK